MSNFILELPAIEVIKDEIKQQNEIIPSGELSEIELFVKDYVDNLLNLDINNSEVKDTVIDYVENFGVEAQIDSSTKSKVLRIPLNELAADSGGNKVANSLVNLKGVVENLNPNNINFDKKPMFAIFSPVKRYFDKYKKSEIIINEILVNLEESKSILRRDNITLKQDQIDMAECSKKLNKYIQMGSLIENRLTENLDNIADLDKFKFLSEEVLFTLRQRIMDLQQQLIINQQGVFAIEVLIRNNKELVRGVDRAKLVTVNALHIAVTVSQALANQKLVLDKITALNQTTNDLILSTSARMREQGVEIQKQSTEAMISSDTLKQSFNDIMTALEEIASFRVNALPKMSTSINEFNDLIDKSNKKIRMIGQIKVI